MDPAASSSTGIFQETDADLLIYMGMRDSDAAVAREAWEEFHRRHVDYLHLVCRRFRSLLGGDAGVCDLVQDTFQRVYERAAQFDPEGRTEPGALRVRVRAWMGQIATNLLRSKLRTDRRLPTEFLEQEEWQEVGGPAAPSDGVAVPAGKLTVYKRALDALSQKQREVLRLYGLYRRPGHDNQKLPDGVAEAAAEQLGTTPENLRQLKKRSLDQVAAFIQDQESGS